MNKIATRAVIWRADPSPAIPKRTKVPSPPRVATIKYCRILSFQFPLDPARSRRCFECECERDDLQRGMERSPRSGHETARRRSDKNPTEEKSHAKTQRHSAAKPQPNAGIADIA